MKKTMAYILFAVMILTLTAGCGRMQDTTPHTTPGVTAAPAVPTPDPDAGIVKDKDGIITPEDSGSAAAPIPSAKPSPEVNTEMIPETGSPSPSPQAGQKNK